MAEEEVTRKRRGEKQVENSYFSADSSLIYSVVERAMEKLNKNPDDLALIEASNKIQSFTFRDIVQEAAEIASGLRLIGIKPGETISFQLPNWHEAVAINLAATSLGVRINPITPIYRGAELRFILEDASSVLIFLPDTFRSINYRKMIDELRGDLKSLRHVFSVRGAAKGSGSYEWLREKGRSALPFTPASITPETPKLLLYTSGTTGKAKGVIHTHESFTEGVISATEYWHISADDKMLIPSPVTHITGYSFGLELPFLTDAKVVLMDKWDPKLAVELIQKYNVTMSIGATPFLKELLEKAQSLERKLPSLRIFACGGASVPAELILQTGKITEKCNSFRVYGSTELPLVTKGFYEESKKNLAATTDGKVVGYQVKIVGLDGEELERGRVGEIRARGPAMLVGYTNEDEFRKSIDKDGFFCTGDLGLLTEDDAIIVTGRLKDIIIRGGENLSPLEIETMLEQHPAVDESAVVAMPHPRLGEGVAAFIRVKKDAELPTLTELAEFLNKSGLARQKFPERLEYVDDFPRTVSGKIRKDQLREALQRPLIISLNQSTTSPTTIQSKMKSDKK